MPRKWMLCVLCLLCWLPGAVVQAAEPTEQLKRTVDQIIEILNNPAMKVPEKQLERRNSIFRIVEERFDFTEMSQRCLSEYWSTLTEAQQKEFEVDFAGLLENSYITRIEKYTDEKVRFEAERPKGEGQVLVRTEIVSGKRSILVDYSLHRIEGQWLVYDVSVEGSSLVSNFRTRFREIMRTEGYKGLKARMNDGLRGLELQDAAEAGKP